jgi:hypothetical protein
MPMLAGAPCGHPGRVYGSVLIRIRDKERWPCHSAVQRSVLKRRSWKHQLQVLEHNMRRIRLLGLALLLPLLATPAIGETGYGDNSYPPGSGVPQQQGPSPLGAWLGTGQPTNLGAPRVTMAFAPNGQFVRVEQTPQFIGRRWGTYQAQQVGPTAWRVLLQTQGQLPQQICSQMTMGGVTCSPMQAPGPIQMSLQLTAPDTMMVDGVPYQRDQGAALQVQVPAQEMLPVPPAYPSGGGGGGYRPLARGPQCDDLQQQRVCTINGGRLITSGGCMRCVTD